jgi:hypothetical protein
MPTWRIDFPADMEQASRLVQRAQAQAEAAQSRLQELPARIDFLAQQVKAGTMTAALQEKDVSAGASFAVPEAVPGLTSADTDLLNALADLSAGQEKGLVSFGLAESLGGGWDKVQEQFQAFADRFQRMFVYLAWVESRQEGRLLGQTVVGWSGDCHTVWGAAVTQEQMALHFQSLQTALLSRINLLSTLTIAVQGAVKLSALLATPGGAILALPVVWKYVRQLMAVL